MLFPCFLDPEMSTSNGIWDAKEGYIWCVLVMISIKSVLIKKIHKMETNRMAMNDVTTEKHIKRFFLLW